MITEESKYYISIETIYTTLTNIGVSLFLSCLYYTTQLSDYHLVEFYLIEDYPNDKELFLSYEFDFDISQ